MNLSVQREVEREGNVGRVKGRGGGGKGGGGGGEFLFRAPLSVIMVQPIVILD